MTAIEFKAAREYLGLDGDWIARRLGLSSERQVRRWEAGTAPIPDGVRVQLEAWEEQTAQIVHANAQLLLDKPEPALAVPRHSPDEWPDRWHRHVAIRVAELVPGLALVEPEPDPT